MRPLIDTTWKYVRNLTDFAILDRLVMKIFGLRTRVPESDSGAGMHKSMISMTNRSQIADSDRFRTYFHTLSTGVIIVEVF